MALPNPTRPLVFYNVDFTQGPPHVPAGKAMSINAPSRRNAVRACTIQRGRQYELDQVQSGVATLDVVDPLEYLHPANTSSPYNSGTNSITSYRCVQIGAWWNPASTNLSGNLLNLSNFPPGGANGYDSSFEGGATWWATLSGAPTMVVSTAQAFVGTHSLAITYTASGDTMGAALRTAPGVTYTLSAYVYVPTGATATLTFEQFPSFTVMGTATSTTTGAWQRLTITATAVDAVMVFRLACAATYPATVYLDAVQLEFASTASAYTATGPILYPLYTGYVERFPLQWDMDGLRGVRPLTCVDGLSVLSRTQIVQSYASTVLADSPTLYIPYSDLSGPTAVQQPSGGTPGYGYTSLGTSGAVNYGGDTFLDGNPAVTVVQQNASPAVAGNNTYITYAGTRAAALTMTTSAATLEFWLKPTSGTTYIGAASVPITENPNTEAAGPAHYFGIYTSAGKIIGNYTDTNGGGGGFGFPGGWSGYPDGNWHYLALVLPGSNNVHYYADGVAGGVGGLGFTPVPTVALNNFFAQATTYFGDAVTDISIANMAFYPTVLSDTKLSAHYQRGVGYLNEVSGTRVARLLGSYWTGTTSVAAGKRKMAPDNASGGNDYNGRFVLDVLQEIQETERGLLYVSAAGTVVFEDSTSRYVNNPASRWVIGENPAGASPVEYPYETLEEDFDPTYTFSQANLTRPANTSFAPLPNPLPTNPPYGQRVLTQQLQVNTDFDLFQAGTFYLKRYGAPVIRVDRLTINAAANPASWAVVLTLEISQRITVVRRTLAGLTTRTDYYIEQISHNIDARSGAWTVDLQCSPVFNTGAWILGDATYGVLGTTTIPVY